MMCFPTDTSKYFGCTKSCLPLMLNNCKLYLGALHNFKNISWQYNSLLALLWGECPIIYTQHLMRLYLLYSHIFTVFKAFRVMIDFDKCYRYLLLCIDMIPTLWSILSHTMWIFDFVKWYEKDFSIICVWQTWSEKVDDPKEVWWK